MVFAGFLAAFLRASIAAVKPPANPPLKRRMHVVFTSAAEPLSPSLTRG
jgi:hypothetical protein